jgi:hypothetical protein
MSFILIATDRARKKKERSIVLPSIIVQNWFFSHRIEVNRPSSSSSCAETGKRKCASMGHSAKIYIYKKNRRKRKLSTQRWVLIDISGEKGREEKKNNERKSWRWCNCNIYIYIHRKWGKVSGRSSCWPSFLAQLLFVLLYMHISL